MSASSKKPRRAWAKQNAGVIAESGSTDGPAELARQARWNKSDEAFADPATVDGETVVLTTAGPLMLVEGALVVAVTTVVYPMLNGPDITPPPPLTGEAPLEQALVVKVASLP
jgi:hypothetical protein